MKKLFVEMVLVLVVLVTSVYSGNSKVIANSNLFESKVSERSSSDIPISEVKYGEKIIIISSEGSEYFVECNMKRGWVAKADVKIIEQKVLTKKQIAHKRKLLAKIQKIKIEQLKRKAENEALMIALDKKNRDIRKEAIKSYETFLARVDSASGYNESQQANAIEDPIKNFNIEE